MEGEGARRCRRGGTWPLAGRAGVWNFRNAGAEMLFLSLTPVLKSRVGGQREVDGGKTR